MARPPQSGVEVRSSEIARHFPDNRDVAGAEVGVFAGDLAQHLLENMPRLRLSLVDSWSPPAKGSDYARSSDPHASVSAEEQEGYFQETLAKVGRFGSRASVYRLDSIIASELFPDASFDFVFLDADHSFEGVRRDIEAWAPKVKPGGWLCGHDYGNSPYDGVKQAVDLFFPERGGIELGQDYTWFARM